MKFSEITYTRPDYPAISQELAALTQKLEGAASAREQADLYKEYETLLSHLNTQTTLCYIRHTVDTTDPFYEEENDYNDQQAPLLEEAVQRFQKGLLDSPYRKELESLLGELLFRNMELERKGFSPEIVPLMQEENKLSSDYQKLYASAKIPFMGKTVTVAQLGPYKESTDRATRRAALEAEGSFFDQNREQFDQIFHQLVKNRTEQAKALGFESYVELGAIRRQRNCYTPQDVAAFRQQVVRDLVPLTVKIKQRQAKRLGIEDFKFHDNALSFKDGSATPQGTPEEILADVNTALTETWAQAEYDLSAIPNHILLPYEEYTYIMNTPVSSLATKSIYQYIKENNITDANGGDLYIGATTWCKGAGTSGVDRMVVYTNHERFVKMDELVPLTRVMSAPNVANVCYDTAYMANVSEVEIMYPQTIMYWDNIGGDA